MKTELINELTNERIMQDGKWGAEFDDKNTPYHWSAYITQYVTRHLIGDPSVVRDDVFRADLIKVAALAIAAIESIDRRYGI